MNIEKLIPIWIEDDRDSYIKEVILDQINFLGMHGQYIHFKFKVDKEVSRGDVIKFKDSFLRCVAKETWKVWSEEVTEYIPERYLLEVWEKQ